VTVLDFRNGYTGHETKDLSGTACLTWLQDGCLQLFCVEMGFQDKELMLDSTKQEELEL